MRAAPEFHGYEMAKHLAETAGRSSLAAYGTLYRALSRLEDMGLLKSRWEDPRAAARDGRPVRRLEWRGETGSPRGASGRAVTQAAEERVAPA